MFQVFYRLAGLLRELHRDETGAIKTKSAEDVAKKWGEVTPGRSAYYEAGVTGAGADWEKNTAEAQDAYKAAVTAPNIGKLFAGGVKKAGGAKYERKAIEVGKDRFGTGVLAATGDYQDGMAPMLSTIQGLTLPARQPRGSAANLERVKTIADALHKKRLAQRAAGV